jgi:hypothetical protein
MSDIRSLIREVLAQELAGIRTSQIRCETVAVRNDADLNAFAHRLLQLAEDPAKRAEIATGKLVFTLGNVGLSPNIPVAQAYQPIAASPPPKMPTVPSRASLEKSLVTEKDINSLPNETRSILVKKATKFTPVASDEIRRLQITIERTHS